KIDKITVWDGGNQGDPSKGSATSNFISQFMKSLPAMHDVASMAGLEMPAFLGKIAPETIEEEVTSSK
ncbi:MAG: hypothetical protein K1000chlam2_01804, partial [Chlamydiae bacterium]|nr:hypothetical protein [Chlamydiota bacterium]